MNKVEEQWVTVDIKALSWYLSEREVRELTKNLDKRQVYATEIEDGHVKEVFQEQWASWLNTEQMIYEELILQFKKPE